MLRARLAKSGFGSNVPLLFFHNPYSPQQPLVPTALFRDEMLQKMCQTGKQPGILVNVIDR